ncbi:MAG: hypothetical protein ACE5JC_11340 [Candidatus Zixiibacteriota bacterium]
MHGIALRNHLSLFLLLLLLVEPTYGQRRSRPEVGRSPTAGKFRYVTVQLGAIAGPSVSSYTDRLNDTFASWGSSDRIEDFGPNFCLGLGVCASLSRHFSYQFGLNIYSFQTEASFIYIDGQGNTVSRRQELRFGGATFGLNFFLNPTLEAETRFWPFLGAGIGLVSFYLDELVDLTVDGYPLGGSSARRTKIALAGGVVCGGVYKVSRRWGLIIQGEYLFSKARMDFYLGDDQEIKLNQGLFKLGTIYLY